MNCPTARRLSRERLFPWRFEILPILRGLRFKRRAKSVRTDPTGNDHIDLNSITTVDMCERSEKQKVIRTAARYTGRSHASLWLLYL